ncbi:MAG TPA: hypothetical protein VNI84_09810 [Pyrinomonadaceae bacterium]|nr:hypothetical protein [Pyrinomonadaceae bacterium]
MEKCFDTGTIQAFLDGELNNALSETVACHIAVCDACALRLAEAEEETAFAFSALDQEFNTLVPTRRLWTKINCSIEQNKSKSVWEKAFANFRLLFANPSIAAFAGLLIVFGIAAVVWNSQINQNDNYVAQINDNSKPKIGASEQIIETPDFSDKNISEAPIFTRAKNTASARESNGFQFVKANFTKSVKTKEATRRQIDLKPTNDFKNSVEPVAAEYLPGEETYIRTIAALEKNVDSRKDEVLKPSARFSFEKDLAVVNDAIDKMKTQVKRNPKNEAAKQVLIASYQNKIDLLSTVAEQNDLTASLR